MATEKELALRMIPVLIRWAKTSWDVQHTYSDLSYAVGHKSPQIGGIMEIIQDIIDELKVKSGKKIPTLNCLVASKSIGMPSEGLDYVIKDYSSYPKDAQKGLVKALNREAHEFKEWDWVLKELGLSSNKIFTPEQLTEKKISAKHGSGGEGKEHLELKEYIVKHPDVFSIKRVSFAQMEHVLLSGDKLDVYFECGNDIHYAIEVKPSTSPDDDVLRGIFQCIKYKAVMDAQRVADYGTYENRVMLVIAGSMSKENKLIANDLGIKYIEDFTIA